MSLDVGLKFLDYFVCDVVTDHAQHLKGRRVGDGRRLRERYIENEAEIHLHLQSVSGPKTNDGCLTFQFSGGMPRQMVKGDAWNNLIDPCVAGDQRKPAVLVVVGQLAQDPEWMELPIIPAVIRLQSLYDCLWSRRDVANSPGAVIPEKARAAVDGKLGRSLCFGRESAAMVAFRERQREVVNATPEIVESVAHEQAELDRRLSSYLGTVGGYEGFGIALDGDDIRLGFRPPLNLRSKRVEVVTCPLKLEDVAVWRWHEMTSA